MKSLLTEIIFYLSNFIVLGGLVFLRDMWRHKDCFEIAARSPVLVCLAGTAHVTLVFLQMTANMIGSHFPCVVVIWVSYISFGTIMAASLLRAARLVVVYDRDLRRKYQQLVKQSAQRKCMAGALGFCSLAAMVSTVRHYEAISDDFDCHFFEETWTFFFPFTIMFSIAMAALASKLKATHDVFKIRNEIGFTCVATVGTSVARTLHLVLVRASWGVDIDTVYPSTVYDLIACTATLHISFFKPLKTFYGIGSRRSLRGITSARRVYSEGDGGAGRNHDHDHAMRSRPAFTNVGWGDERKPDTWGVLQMLRNSTLQPLLVNFCEQSLCGESVDFLVDVAIHYESMSNPEEQFETLKDIVDNYLAEGAENEVNVSSAQRSAAAKWLTRKDEFFALEAEARAHILDGQRDEIAKMLGENLLAKFKKTELATTAMRALKDIASADTTEGKEGGQHEDEGMRIMLQASAALEMARIQRLARAGKNSSKPGSPVGVNSRKSRKTIGTSNNDAKGSGGGGRDSEEDLEDSCSFMTFGTPDTSCSEYLKN
ncbi:unnamed protein product [Pylaiella littoralis]